ncbi:MAG: VWA domain-containing protein, partial [Syntrophales bacterium]
FEEYILLDILVVATGSKKMLETLPLGLLEYFDLVNFSYMNDRAAERQIILNNLEHRGQGGLLSETTVDKAINIVSRTRNHSEVQRGVSTRGAMRFTELISSLKEMNVPDEEGLLRYGGHSSLPHRLDLAPHVDVPGKRKQIINEILDEVLEVQAKKEVIAFSKDDLLSLVEEISRNEHFRRPLKCGAFDLLLKRVQRFSESKLSQMVKMMMDHLEELYPMQYRAAALTDELLKNVEEIRKRDERIDKLRRKLEAEALKETLDYLEQQKILERGAVGWELSRRGISFLLERLTPNLEASHFYGYGKHSTGKKLSMGEGREVGVRHFRFGDRYKDVSFKDTVRETIRNRRQMVTKDDIMVTTKDIRAKIDFVLVVDLSGTMSQLEKLWHAKESAMVLSLAAAQYHDRVGVVSFSNLADVVVDITGSPERLTRRVIDLELHRNAFTNIGYGILKAAQLFARHRGGRASQHMIIISDGDATAPDPSPQRYALRQAVMAAKKGITISCVCINEESADPELMRRIARIGRGKVHFIDPECMTSAVLEERYAANFPGH